MVLNNSRLGEIMKKYIILVFIHVILNGCWSSDSDNLNETGTSTPLPPTVETLALENILSNSARSGGIVTAEGSSIVTARGVCWDTSLIPTTANSKTTDGSGTGSFTSLITGLSANTTYTVRAYATNNAGTSYGRKVSFTTTATITAPSAPTLTSPTNGATNQSTDPTLSWGASSGATNYTLQVSINSLFSSYVHNQNVGNNTSQQLSGLSNNTTYYWRVNTSNSVGTSIWSSIWSFTTTNGISVDGTPCPGTPTVTYAGKTYNTVQIGTQCWLKENLDIGTMVYMIDSQSNNSSIEKYCYYNDPDLCKTYGGLYQWAEAVQYKNGATNINSTNPAFSGNVQGICPSGWHIPTLGEFETLKAAVSNNSNALKAIGQGTGSGAGTNTSGFYALLAGGRWHDGNNYGLGEKAIFWSFTEKTPTAAYHMSLDYGTSDVHLTDIYITKKNGFSVRCVKD
ncbi:MAG: hypothetical protein KF816_02920 [Melioribacteraceae bacterium]|nr:hypothetical protein [Melioribacteraceae bacterium]